MHISVVILIQTEFFGIPPTYLPVKLGMYKAEIPKISTI